MQRMSLCILIFVIVLCASCDSTEPERIANPEYGISPGEYGLEQSISLNCGTTGASIYYTLNGTEPDSSSSLYTEPLILQEIIPTMLNQVTIKARAYRIDLGYSSTCAGIYSVHYSNSVQQLTILPGEIDQELGAEITMSALPVDARIFYTLDGSEPRPGVNLYTEPLHFELPGVVSINVIVCKEGWNPLGPVNKTYHVTMPPLPMVWVQGGETAYKGESVAVGSFHIDKYEVPQNNYYSVMGATLGQKHASLPIRDATYPVNYVSWFQAIAYCNRRSILEGYTPCYSYQSEGNTNPGNWPEGWDENDANGGKISCNWNANGYRLPTELEWMWAAQGGLATHNWPYSGHEWIDPCGWFDLNSGFSVHALGMKISNELGIYDMTGNLNEWCWDTYNPSERKDQQKGRGHIKADMKLIKGGSYYVDSLACEITHQAAMAPSYMNSATVGLRLVRR